MKKLIFVSILFAFCLAAFSQTTEKTTGWSKYTNVSVTNEQIIHALKHGDTDGIFVEGMTPAQWANDFIASYNKFTAPHTGTYIINNETLYAVLERLTPENAEWENGGIKTTAWATGGKVYAYTRDPYEGEIVYCDMGYPTFSKMCGNPLQAQLSFVPYELPDDDGGKIYTTEKVIKTEEGTTINIFVNAQGGNVTNSGNNEVTNTSPFGTYDPYKQPVIQQPPVTQTTGCTNCNPCNNCNTTTTQVVDNSGSDADWETAYWSKKNYQANVANAVGTWLNLGVNTFGVVWNATHPAQNTFNSYYYTNGNPPVGNGPVNWPNGPNTNGYYPGNGGPTNWGNGW